MRDNAFLSLKKNIDYLKGHQTHFVFMVVLSLLLIFSVYLQLETLNQKYILENDAKNTAYKIENSVFDALNGLIDSVRLNEEFKKVMTARGLAEHPEVIAILTILSSSSDADMLYLLDRKGRVFTSSISNGISLTGEDLNQRPYFKNASEWKNYFYSAIGLATKRRGIYCSRMISVNGEQIVIVAKMGMRETEELLSEIKGIAALISPENIIFASGDNSRLFKSLDLNGLGFPAKQIDVKQYGDTAPVSAGLVIKKRVLYDGKDKYLYTLIPVGKNGWKLLAAQQTSVVVPLDGPANIILLTVVISVLTLLVIFLLFIRNANRRKTAERHIVNSEKHLRKILESTKEGFWQVDKNGNTIDINPAMCRILGYTKAELIGEPVSIYVKGVSAEIIKEYLLKSQQYDKTDPFEMDFVKKDGSKVPVIIKGTPLFSDTGEFIGAFAMISNMEDLFNVEKALRQSEHNYREIFDSVNDAIFIHDLKDFHLVDVNKKMLEMYRCTKEQALSPGLYDKHFDSEERKIEYSRKAAEGIPQVFEWHASTWDNEPFWAEVSLKRAVIAGEDRVIAVVRNIEERKKAEEALMESEKKFRDMAENTADWIWEMDETGLIRYSNPQVFKLMGYLPEELVGSKSQEKVVTQEKWEEFQDLLKSSEKEEVLSMESEVKHKNGTKVAVDTKIIPFEVSGEKLRMFRGVSRDITDKKRAEQKIIMAMEELKRSNKDLEEFAYVASHDLKEPLRMVSSYVKLLEKKYADKLDNDAKDYIGYAADGAKRMQRLISDLLMYSRLGRTNIEFMDVDMDDLVKEVINSLELRIHEINADVIVETKLPVIYADRTQMVQLFQNLMANSLKFISDKKPEIRIGCEKKNGLYEFYVKDNGIGIDKAYFEKVFVIFQQLHTKDKYPGTGIGLSVCKKVVEQHGGTIRVESQEGKGTAFYFTISLELKEN